MVSAQFDSNLSLACLLITLRVRDFLCHSCCTRALVAFCQNAGVHSGDATLLLPAQKVWVETIRRVKRVASAICKALNISGPFNIQLMAKMQDVMVKVQAWVLVLALALILA